MDEQEVGNTVAEMQQYEENGFIISFMGEKEPDTIYTVHRNGVELGQFWLDYNGHVLASSNVEDAIAVLRDIGYRFTADVMVKDLPEEKLAVLEALNS